MKRVKLTVAYDGTNYCGWQQQPNGICIEEVLNRELSRLLGEEIQVIGASRTDSGVHARGNVAVFDTSARMPADKICIALNQRLPKDIVIQESCEVAPDYHPRKCNTRKTYEYRILNRRVPLPDQRFNSYFYYYPLDVEKMRQAAQYLVGEHDFKSFCSIRTQVEDTVRRIYSIQLSKVEDRIDIRISGNGFLYNMVRIIVGSLIKVGCGFWEPEKIKEVLEARDRSQAGPKAPAEGLTLLSIEEEPLPAEIVEKNSHWSYRVNQKEISSYGQAYIHIYSCDEADFYRLLVRLVKQASRNGAANINVRDDTGHIKSGYKADYFRFGEPYHQWMMEKALQGNAAAVDDVMDFSSVELEPLCSREELSALRDGTESEAGGKSVGLYAQKRLLQRISGYCESENESFRSVPGGCRREKEQLVSDMEQGECFCLVCYKGKAAGVLSYCILEEENQPVDLSRMSSAEQCEYESQQEERKLDKAENTLKILELEALGINEAMRGKGIGTACLRKLEELAKAEGCSSLRLICADSNPAMRLYERNGFCKKKLFSTWYTTRDEKRNRSSDTGLQA